MAAPQPKRARVDAETPPLLFYGMTGPLGWMSNFSRFDVVEDGMTFMSNEHYFMYHKAIAMGDADAAEKVLTAPTPLAAKRVGRTVRNWDEALWNRVREGVMVRGLELKIEQHPVLRDALAATGDKILGEASPRDRVWGIGMGKTNPGAADTANWKGKNLLGKAWMCVREGL